MSKMIYKIDRVDPKEAADYAIRYDASDTAEVYAKMKGEKEFKTDFKKNNTAMDVRMGGDEITKKEYDEF